VGLTFGACSPGAARSIKSGLREKDHEDTA
jgi:hypothetical protein